MRIFARLVGAVIPPRILSTDTWLADVEADHEVWEPHQLTDPEPLSGVSVTPAASGQGGGHSDVELLLEDVDRLFNRLNP